jgi:uridylate kinase
MNRDIFVKITGQILENEQNLDIFIKNLSLVSKRLKNSQLFLIIGGGKKVDQIRFLYENNPKKLNKEWNYLSNNNNESSPSKEIIAHWLSIKKMDQNGQIFEEKMGKLNNVEVMKVYNSLRNDNFLPKSWSVTSDSITYYMAAKHLNQQKTSKQVILFKIIDGIFDPGNNNKIERRKHNIEGHLIKKLVLKPGKNSINLKSYPFDDYLLNLIDYYGIPCIIANYSRINELEKLLDFSDPISCSRIFKYA